MTCRRCGCHLPENEQAAYGSFCESCWTLPFGRCPASPASVDQPKFYKPRQDRRGGFNDDEQLRAMKRLLGIVG